MKYETVKNLEVNMGEYFYDIKISYPFRKQEIKIEKHREKN